MNKQQRWVATYDELDVFFNLASTQEIAAFRAFYYHLFGKQWEQAWKPRQ